jgi:hypothetical protein
MNASPCFVVKVEDSLYDISGSHGGVYEDGRLDIDTQET